MNIRNKFLLTLLVGATSLALFLPNASAVGMVTIDYGTRHSGDGGEFNAYSSDLNPGARGYVTTVGLNPGTMADVGHGMGFETFCVETNEYFSPGHSYYYAISNGAINGGVSGGNPDRLSQGTAWLYLNFAHGTLAGYDYAGPNGNDSSAAALQATIWWLEGEEANQPSNAFTTAVIGQFGNAANAMANNDAKIYGVGVLNLWGDSRHTQFAQDQLVLLPDGGTTAMLLGLGLLGLFLVRRKITSA